MLLSDMVINGAAFGDIEWSLSSQSFQEILKKYFYLLYFLKETFEL